jgi:hypothetical protein
MHTATPAFALLAVTAFPSYRVLALGSAPSAERQNTTSQMVLPESAPLSDIEIRWQDGDGDGCGAKDIADCDYHRITVRGDGLVTLEDLGWGANAPTVGPRQRSVPTDDVVALLNDLLKARFLESPSTFAGPRHAVRKGDSVFFYWSSAGAGFRWVDLTLQVGANAKIVRLNELTPHDLRSVERRIWETFGPKAWPAR